MDEQEKQKRIQLMQAALVQALAEAVPGAAFDSRAMFGGMGFYVDGRMFAAWFGEGLALKLDDASREALLTEGGAKTSMSRQYIETPPAFLNDPSRLVPWVVRSVAYVKAQPLRKPRRKNVPRKGS